MAARFIAGVVIGALVVTASIAHAQSGGEQQSRANAKALFEHGVADYAAGQYASALGNFQEAFRVRPHPLVNVNIANCYDKLAKPMQALFHFQRFLESNAGTAAQREEVVAAVERLKQQVGKVMLRITPDGALAIIDQGEQRKAPILDAVQLEAGKHTLEVHLDGYKTVERSLNVRGGSTLELNIALEPERAGAPVVAAASGTAPALRGGASLEPSLVIKPATPAAVAEPAPAPALPAPEPTEPVASAQPPEPAAPAPEAPPPSTGARTRATASRLPMEVWIAGGVSLTLATAGLITGLLALSANSDFEEARSARFLDTATGLQRLQSYNDARDAASRANALALTTDILLTGALLGAGTTVYLIASARAEERRGSRAAKPSATLTPLVSRHGAGMQLRTLF